MKKMIMFIFVVAVLCIGAVEAQAYTAGASFTGPTMVGTATVPGSTLSVQPSNNVYMNYNGNTSGQSYGAAAHNKAGDKVFGTGGGATGGVTCSSGIYFIQNTSYVGDALLPTDPTDCFNGTATGWTAQ